MDCGNLVWAILVLAVAWPAAALIMFYSIRRPLAAFLTANAGGRAPALPAPKAPSAESAGAGAPAAEPSAEPSAEAAALEQGPVPQAHPIADCREIIGVLSPEERELYLKIRAANGAYQVNNFFPRFMRNSREHALLKALRESQLIQPAEGGSWEGHKTPEVTRFARIVEKICPELVKKAD